MSVPHKRSTVEACNGKLILLVYCNVLYHSAINDEECLMLALDGDLSRLQRRDVSIGRQGRNMSPML